MSSTSHLTVAANDDDANANKRHSSGNLRGPPRDGTSNFLHPSSPTTRNAKYFYYVNAEPARQQSIPTTDTATTIVTASTAVAVASSSLNLRRKLSAISLPVPWYKRTRSPSDEKNSLKARRMSRDRLLTLDRLMSTGGASAGTDDEQNSPVNDVTPLHESLDKNARQVKENGYLHKPSHLMTR